MFENSEKLLNDFKKKYKEFLDNNSSFDDSIKQKISDYIHLL